jgi:hypothetical protein
MDYKMKKLITIAVMGLFVMTAYAQTDNAGLFPPGHVLLLATW